MGPREGANKPLAVFKHCGGVMIKKSLKIRVERDSLSYRRALCACYGNDKRRRIKSQNLPKPQTQEAAGDRNHELLANDVISY